MRTVAAAAGAILAATGWLTLTAPPDLGDSPWRHCVESPSHSSLDCYLPGDVPPGAVVVWSGPEDYIPD